MAGDGVRTSWKTKVQRKLAEPSTMLGLSMLATLAGLNPALVSGVVGVAQDSLQTGSLSVASITAILGIWLKEKGGQ